MYQFQGYSKLVLVINLVVFDCIKSIVTVKAKNIKFEEKPVKVQNVLTKFVISFKH